MVASPFRGTAALLITWPFLGFNAIRSCERLADLPYILLLLDFLSFLVPIQRRYSSLFLVVVSGRVWSHIVHDTFSLSLLLFLQASLMAPSSSPSAPALTTLQSQLPPPPQHRPSSPDLSPRASQSAPRCPNAPPERRPPKTNPLRNPPPSPLNPTVPHRVSCAVPQSRTRQIGRQLRGPRSLCRRQ